MATDGRDCVCGDAGDLGVGQSLEVAQDDRDALRRRQRGDGVSDSIDGQITFRLLAGLVTRKTLNRITRTRATESLDLLGDIPATGDEPGQQTERALTADAVTDAVAALPPPQRIAIVLRHFEGLSNAEIADITASTVPAVRSHLFRGRRTLSQTLEQWR